MLHSNLISGGAAFCLVGSFLNSERARGPETSGTCLRFQDAVRAVSITVRDAGTGVLPRPPLRRGAKRGVTSVCTCKNQHIQNPRPL